MSTEKNTAVAERLRMIRGVKSKRFFSTELGVSPQVYQKYEEGRIPSARQLLQIAHRLHVDPNWLLNGSKHVESTELRLPIPDGMVQRILARQQPDNGTGTPLEMTVADAVAYIARQLDLDPNRVMETIIDLVKQRPAKPSPAPPIANSEGP
jgi:transcriptional regulator with XRE-family HTH domain